MLVSKTEMLLDTDVHAFAETRPHKQENVRLWVFPLALVLALAHVVAIVLNCSAVAPNGFATAYAIYEGGAFVLLLLALVNWAIKRRGCRGLRPGEIVILYVAVTIAGSVTGQSTMNHLVPALLYPRYQTQIPTGIALMRNVVPAWLAPREANVIRTYFEGGASFRNQLDLLQRWLLPMSLWIVFWMVILGVMYCLNIILYRPWVDGERLTFPTTRLPLEIAWGGGFGGKVGGASFWIGSFLGFSVVSWAALSARFGLPPLTTLTQIDAFFPTSPWNGLKPMWIGVWPFAVGIAFFAPNDLLLSAWVFFLLRKALEVAGVAYGLRSPDLGTAGFPYNRAQAAGAWIGLFLLLVLRNRRPFSNALHQALSRTGGRLAWAGRGLMAGVLFLLVFSVMAGMQWWIAFIFFGVYFAFTITYTRLWAQVGPPLIEAFFVNPQLLLKDVIGTSAMTTGSLGMMATFYWFNRTYVELPMAHQMEGFTLGDRTGLSPKNVGITILGISLFAVVVFWLCHLVILNWYGQLTPSHGLAVSASATEGFTWLSQDATNPRGPNWTSTTFTAVGAAIVLGLGWLAGTQARFPLHPAGYPLAISYALEYSWFSMLLAWAIKTVVLQFGGLRSYTRAMPLFLGLILGDLAGRPIWGLITLAWR